MDEGDTTSNISSLADVPPYLKEQYSPLTEVFQAHTATFPSRKSPESNSDAVIRSLKALQEKIKSLEVERLAAADRFKVLSQETSTDPVSTTSSHTRPTTGPPISTPFSIGGRSIGITTDTQMTSAHASHIQTATGHASSVASTHTGASGLGGVRYNTPLDVGSSPHLHEAATTAGLKSRLDSLDDRLSQQAQELDAMQRKLRLSDTHSRHTSTQQPPSAHSPRTPKHTCPHTAKGSPCKCTVTDDKLRSLERGVHHLREAQSKTERKVDELETCIESSPRGRGAPEDLVDGGRRTQQTRRKVKPKLKKTKVPARQLVRAHSDPVCKDGGLALKCLPRPVPGVHYRMDMRDVPFILGSSTTPSHSVSANYQQVLSLMKTHNHVLCGAAAVSSKKRGRNGRQKKAMRKDISDEELDVLLAGLEEEFGALTFEHQALAQHLQDNVESQKPRVRVTLELQLKHLEEQLESKSEQIRIVSKQIAHQSTNQVKQGPKHHSPVVTILKECGNEEPSSLKDTQTQLSFLKKMKALQSTLQRDDLNWK